MIDLIFLLLSFHLELCVSQAGLYREQTEKKTVAEASLGDSLGTTICGGIINWDWTGGEVGL